jgi:hypothetical protein
VNFPSAACGAMKPSAGPCRTNVQSPPLRTDLHPSDRHAGRRRGRSRGETARAATDHNDIGRAVHSRPGGGHSDGTQCAVSTLPAPELASGPIGSTILQFRTSPQADTA